MSKSDIRSYLKKNAKKGHWKESFKAFEEDKAWKKYSSTIALTVLSYIDEEGMKQSDLAERLNCSPQRLSKLLKGSENLTLKTISELEKATNLNLIQIFSYREQEGLHLVKSQIYKMYQETINWQVTSGRPESSTIIFHYKTKGGTVNLRANPQIASEPSETDQ